jgi:hypothetical protein
MVSNGNSGDQTASTAFELREALETLIDDFELLQCERSAFLERTEDALRRSRVRAAGLTSTTERTAMSAVTIEVLANRAFAEHELTVYESLLHDLRHRLSRLGRG